MIVKRDMKTPKLIRDIKDDIFRCMCGDLAEHARVNIILTQLVRKLYRLENRAVYNHCLQPNRRKVK